MKFNSEAERMQHPFASLIPQHLWIDIFENELPDDYLPIMEAPTEELINTLRNYFEKFEGTKNSNIQLWLAVVYSHPNLDDKIIEDFFDINCSRCSLLLDCMILSGNEALFNKIILDITRGLDEFFGSKDEDEEDRLKQAKYFGSANPMLTDQSLRLAANNGYLEFFKFIESQTPGFIKNLFAKEHYRLYEKAISHGNLNIMEHIENSLSPETLEKVINSPDIKSAFSWAFFNKYFAVVNHLLKRNPNFLSRDKINFYIKKILKPDILEVTGDERKYHPKDEAEFLLFLQQQLTPENDPDFDTHLAVINTKVQKLMEEAAKTLSPPAAPVRPVGNFSFFNAREQNSEPEELSQPHYFG